MANSRSKKKISAWVVFLPVATISIAAAVGLYFLRSHSQDAARMDDSAGLHAENVVPDFTLSQLNGKSIKISEMSSKVLMINFWATWCEACMEEMPSIVKLREAYKNRGFEVLGVNLDEEPNLAVPKIVKQLNIGFPIFRDPEGKVADLFDVHAIPLTVVMDSKRRILFVRDGEQNWNSETMKAQLEQWLTQ